MEFFVVISIIVTIDFFYTSWLREIPEITHNETCKLKFFFCTNIKYANIISLVKRTYTIVAYVFVHKKPQRNVNHFCDMFVIAEAELSFISVGKIILVYLGKCFFE